MRRLSWLLIVLLLAGCATRRDVVQLKGGPSVGLSVPQEWHYYPGHKAWGLQKRTSGSLNWHFRVVGVRNDLQTQAEELLQSMTSDPSAFKQSYPLQRSLDDLIEALEQQRGASQRASLARLQAIVDELKLLRQRIVKGPPPSEQELQDALKRWQIEMEEMGSDETSRLALTLSAVNSFLRLDPDRLEPQPITVAGYPGQLVTVTDNQPVMKYALVPWTEQQVVVFEFFDNQRAGTFEQVEPILDSVQLGLEREEAKGWQSVFDYDKDSLLAFLLGSLVLLVTVLPAVVSSQSAFRLAQQEGEFGQESTELIVRSVSRTFAVVASFVLVVMMALVLLDAATGKGSLWMILLVIPGAFLAGLAWLVGLLAGHAAAYAGRRAFRYGRLPYTLAVVMGLIGGTLAAVVAGFILAEVG